jgi:hypothetical protein
MITAMIERSEAAELDEATLKDRAALIAAGYQGIFPPFLAFYVQSILYNAERSIAAFRRFDIAVERSAAPGLIVSTVQEALTHAGALSRFFWPVKKGDSLATARGERLRELFSLSEASPLKSRKLRNAFEHFDEDLDRFLLYDRFGYFFPGPLVDDHTLADEVIGNIFKLVDPVHGICVLLGKKFEFLPVRSEVQRILDRAFKLG